MDKTHLNKKIAFMEPITVKLMYCSACQIHTNHHRTQSGEMVCWCGNVDDPVEAGEEAQGENHDEQ